MARALVGAVAGRYDRGRKPGWLADSADVERAAQRKRESELLAEIAILRAATELEPQIGAEGSAVAENPDTASHAGANLVSRVVEIDLELVGSKS